MDWVLGIIRRGERPLLAGLLIATVLTGVPASLVPLRAASTSQPTTAPTDARLIARWLAELAGADAKVRESARLRLTDLRRGDLPVLRQLVQQSRPLAPSQAAMLRQVVQEIYLAGEDYEKDSTKGFLGILMDRAAFDTRDLQQPNENVQVPGVVVADRIPGFCASRMLRDGDIILGTVEPAHSFSSPSDLQTAIGSLEPGTAVDIQVLRQGQVIRVRLTLDSRPIEADSFDAAESFRARRADKFGDYWQKNFAPLLKEVVG